MVVTKGLQQTSKSYPTSLSQVSPPKGIIAFQMDVTMYAKQKAIEVNTHSNNNI